MSKKGSEEGLLGMSVSLYVSLSMCLQVHLGLCVSLYVCVCVCVSGVSVCKRLSMDTRSLNFSSCLQGWRVGCRGVG